MVFKGIIAMTSVFCLLLCESASADDQVLGLLKQMRAEIRTLKQQADRSEARIKELETQLVRERGENRQSSAAAPLAANSPPLGSIAGAEDSGHDEIAEASAPAPAADAQHQSGQQTPVVVANDNIIRGKGGVTEGGAPEPPRIGKEILPGVSATFGGYIESASAYRSKFEGQDVNSNFNTSIPFENNANAHQTEFRESARQSRISLLLKGDYDENTRLASYLEMDFLGAGSSSNSNQGNGYVPRLRLGYATIDKSNWGFHFLGGQAWSMLTTNKTGITARTEIIPLTGDGGFVPGFNYTRSPQLRFVGDFFDHKVWAGLSLESPQWNNGGGSVGVPATVLNGAANVTASTTPNVGSMNAIALSSDVAPDIIGKLAFDPGWGHYELFGLTRFFHSTVNNPANTSLSNHTVESIAGGAAAVLPVIRSLLDVQLNFTGGSGVGRYSSAQLPDAAFSTSGGMVPLTEYTGLLGVVAHPDPDLDIYTYLGGELVERYNQNSANNTYGYGNVNANLAGCGAPIVSAAAAVATSSGGVVTNPGGCFAQTHSVWQVAPGFWARLYHGDAGTVKTGLQYSYTQRAGFSGLGGSTPRTDENMLILTFRYYPLQK